MGGRGFPITIFLLFLTWASVAQEIPKDPQPDPSPPSKSVVRGRAYYEDSGMPIRRGLTGLIRIDDNNFPKDPNMSIGNDLAPENWFVTGDDGTFEIREVKAGKYFVAVNVPNVLSPQSVNSYFGGHRGLSKARLDELFTIVEVDGLNEIAISVPVKRGASIAGYVRYADRTPVVSVHIDLFRRSTEIGEDNVVSVKKLSSDDRGYFRFTDLLPGKYFLSVTEFAAHAASSRENIYRLSRGSELKTFYPNVRDLSEAEEVEVGWGSSIDGIEIEIPANDLRTLSGIVLESDTGKPRKQALVQFERIVDLDSDASFFDGNAWNQITTGDDGAFLFKDLPPGKYRLQVSLCPSFVCKDAPYARTTRTVDLESQYVQDISIELPLSASVRGIVRMDTVAVPPRFVHVWIVDLDTKDLFSTTIRLDPANVLTAGQAANLDFALEGISEGEYLFGISSEGDQIVQSIFIGTKDYTNQKLTIKPSDKIENVRVSLTSKHSLLRGKVFDAKKNPAVKATIQLVPVDRSKQDGLVFYYAATTDLNGSFEIKAAAGEYYITFPTSRSNRIIDKEWLEKVQRGAERVTLSESRPTELSLTIVELD